MGWIKRVWRLILPLLCRQGDIDTLFIVANLKEGDKTALKNKLNPERSLSMFDFLDIIVRIAVAKYTKPLEWQLLPAQAVEVSALW